MGGWKSKKTVLGFFFWHFHVVLMKERKKAPESKTHNFFLSVVSFPFGMFFLLT